jgi:hypothetical protein
MRLEEAERVGYGFDPPKIAVAPNAPKISAKSKAEIAAQVAERRGIVLVGSAGLEPATSCL